MKNSAKIPRVVNTDAPVKNDGKPRQPNDRDESPDIQSQSLKPKEQIKHAYNDLEQGLIDTDMRGKHGLDANREADSLMHQDKKVKNNFAADLNA